MCNVHSLAPRNSVQHVLVFINNTKFYKNQSYSISSKAKTILLLLYLREVSYLVFHMWK